MERFYTVAQVAQILRLHPKTVQGMLRRGVISCHVLGTKTRRISESDLAEYLAAHEQPARVGAK